ncbi:MAG: hypothetical protein L6Q47_16625 [Ignavibacteriaceae bacterium]|nr:hypothetical protein [Ignavibacteriaceae bacterium]
MYFALLNYLGGVLSLNKITMMKQNRNYDLNKWVMLPQEVEGTYRFDGKMYATSNAADFISFDDFRLIISSIREFVRIHDGADYLFVFKNERLGRKIFVIDNLNDQMKSSSDSRFTLEHNYFTIMMEEDY